jgi:6-pyruvoyl-tetrahydropterin synthase
MVCDFGDISNIIKSFDHKCLNEIIEQPTTENLAKLIFEKLKCKYCLKVEVCEGETSFATYFNDEMLESFTY